jgi:hypothetical protein
LAPPAQRTKARYMNIDVVLKYVREKLLPVFNNPSKYAQILNVPNQELKEKTAWVGDHLTTTRLWEQFMIVAETTRATVNRS